MSASIATSAIYISDTPAQIKNKINRHAFSGGQDTAELHRLHGGNCTVDVAFQYLQFFLDDDVELESIRQRYTSGEMSSSEIKQRCISVVQDLVKTVQDRRVKIDENVVKSFMDPDVPRKCNLRPAVGQAPISLEKLKL
jgi:tryptophanyl-tRNA synthetase